ncbi:MAG: hypothetical protein AAB592_01640 [Patescibacteria group bacterium]
MDEKETGSGGEVGGPFAGLDIIHPADGTGASDKFVVDHNPNLTASAVWRGADVAANPDAVDIADADGRPEDRLVVTDVDLAGSADAMGGVITSPGLPVARATPPRPVAVPRVARTTPPGSVRRQPVGLGHDAPTAPHPVFVLSDDFLKNFQNGIADTPLGEVTEVINAMRVASDDIQKTRYADCLRNAEMVLDIESARLGAEIAEKRAIVAASPADPHRVSAAIHESFRAVIGSTSLAAVGKNLTELEELKFNLAQMDSARRAVAFITRRSIENLTRLLSVGQPPRFVEDAHGIRGLRVRSETIAAHIAVHPADAFTWDSIAHDGPLAVSQAAIAEELLFLEDAAGKIGELKSKREAVAKAEKYLRSATPKPA